VNPDRVRRLEYFVDQAVEGNVILQFGMATVIEGNAARGAIVAQTERIGRVRVFRERLDNAIGVKRNRVRQII